MRTTLVIALVLLSTCHACIISIGGKIADPCACGLQTTVASNQDCAPGVENPPSSTTLWIPSANSVNLAQFPRNPLNTNEAAIVNGLLPLEIEGINFDTMPSGQAELCLGRYDAVRGQALACSAGCDNTFGANTRITTVNVPGISTNTRRRVSIPFGNNPVTASLWNNRQLELESEPRRICWTIGNQNGGPVAWTGLRLGVAWNCDPAQPTQTCNNYFTAAQVYPSSAINQQQLGLIQARTVCCSRLTPSFIFPGRMGVCINPNTQSCCGATTIERTQERCCNSTYEFTAYHEGTCRCGTVRDIPRPTNPAPDANIGQNVQTGGNIDCPFDGSVQQECCLPTKYPEIGVQTNNLNFEAPIGQCFNPVKHRCCNTGQRYDPGSNQCCVINGIQSLNVPCPCGADADCAGGQTRNNVAVNTQPSMACCQQSAPVPREVPGCSIYANFPTGNGPAEIQRCFGVCMDTRYQKCCNGQVCRANYERCCNSTCCNDFVGTCIKGVRAGARGFPSNPLFWNPLTTNNRGTVVGQNVEFEQCSTVEQIDPINAFWIFVLPALLLFGTLVLTAMALVFANKVTATPLTFLEKLMLIGALLVIVLACALFFSPVWKYGVVAVLVAVLVIITAATRVRWLNILTLIILFIGLLFWVDPFSGNALFSFPNGRREPNGIPDYDTSGIFSSIGRLWYNEDDLQPAINNEMFNARHYCHRFYNYFMYDSNLRDFDRYDNPEVTTFGYCSYEWILALLFIAGFILMLLLLLLLLTLLAMILRFRKARFEPIELEVVDSDEIPVY